MVLFSLIEFLKGTFRISASGANTPRKRAFRSDCGHNLNDALSSVLWGQCWMLERVTALEQSRIQA